LSAALNKEIQLRQTKRYGEAGIADHKITDLAAPLSLNRSCSPESTPLREHRGTA
jgi:hypothetical protein